MGFILLMTLCSTLTNNNAFGVFCQWASWLITIYWFYTVPYLSKLFIQDASFIHSHQQYFENDSSNLSICIYDPRAIWGYYFAQEHLACRMEQPGIKPTTLWLLDAYLIKRMKLCRHFSLSNSLQFVPALDYNDHQEAASFNNQSCSPLIVSPPAHGRSFSPKRYVCIC